MQSLQLVIVTFKQNLKSKDKAPCFSYLVVEETDVLGIHKNKLVISKVPMVSRPRLQESRHQTGNCEVGCRPRAGHLPNAPSWGPGSDLQHNPSRGEKKHSGGFSDHASSVWLCCCSLDCYPMMLSWIQPRLALDLQSSCLRFQITRVHHHSQLPLLLIFMSNNTKQSMAVFPNYPGMFAITENIILYFTSQI